MHSITKNMLFALLIIMAYLPMTVVNAMSDITVPVQTLTVSNMTMAAMDMADCHHQQASEQCDHCSTKHNCHCVHGSCSVSLGITTQYAVPSINRNSKNNDKGLRINTVFQQPNRLLRPPISI